MSSDSHACQDLDEDRARPPRLVIDDGPLILATCESVTLSIAAFEKRRSVLVGSGNRSRGHEQSMIDLRVQEHACP